MFVSIISLVFETIPFSWLLIMEENSKDLSCDVSL